MASSSKLNEQQVADGFNILRQQQKQIGMKMGEITQEIKEHQLVMENLKPMDTSRTCYRMIGGVLVQKTVGEVFPILEHNVEQLNKLMSTLENQLEAKGQELVDYRDKHNIKLQSDRSEAANPSQSSQKPASNTGVLVN